MTDETGDPQGAVQSSNTPDAAETTTGPSPLDGQFVPEPVGAEGVAQGTEDTPRDEQGRFVSPTPDEAQPDPLAKFSPQLVDFARAAYLTDDQIAKFDDPSMLYDVVRGRAASMQPVQAPASTAAGPEAPQGAQPPTVASDLVIEDLELELDADFSEELAKPVKGLVDYVNKLKTNLVTEVHNLRKQNAELTAGVTQSASAAQRAVVQQQTTQWDQRASSVPGLVDAVGRPSQALGNPDSPQGQAWAELAPLIAARAQAQNVPEHLVDFGRATREAFAAYRAIGGNGKVPGPGSAPGMAVRPAARRSAAPAMKANMTIEEDHAARLANLENAFNQAGGNPFGLETGQRVI